MFTGLIERLCKVKSIEKQDAASGSGHTITIADAASILDDCNIGDSICVNGACLTVTEFSSSEEGGWFKIGAAPETLRRTNLGELSVGDGVNCERAMKAHARFGGHFVQGHVDTTASLVSIEPNGEALTLTLRLTHAPGILPLPSELAAYIIPKGYVTLDGASLTVIDVSPPQGGPLNGNASASASQPISEVVEFSIMLIAHTQSIIGLPKKKVGDTINVEMDMVGKYVVRGLLIREAQTGGAK